MFKRIFPPEDVVASLGAEELPCPVTVKLRNILEVEESSGSPTIVEGKEEDALQKINDAIQNGNNVCFSLNCRLARNESIKIFSGKSFEDRHSIKILKVGKIELEGGWYDEIAINEKSLSVSIKNCKVRRLSVFEGADATLKLENTWIARFIVKSGSIKNLSADDGGIIRIDCPPPGAMNPFSGSVSFANTFFPRSRRSNLATGAQPYRNLRFHLASLQNSPAASLFHSLEQAVERDDETGLNKVLSWLYEISSDCGAAPQRPLGILVLLWLFTFILFAASDAAVVAIPYDQAVGWQLSLFGDDCGARFLRAGVLSILPLSWLGSFVGQARLMPVMAENIYAHAWLIIEGIASTILIALFLLALRRKFKMGA